MPVAAEGKPEVDEREGGKEEKRTSKINRKYASMIAVWARSEVRRQKTAGSLVRQRSVRQ